MSSNGLVLGALSIAHLKSCWLLACFGTLPAPSTPLAHQGGLVECNPFPLRAKSGHRTTPWEINPCIESTITRSVFRCSDIALHHFYGKVQLLILSQYFPLFSTISLRDSENILVEPIVQEQANGKRIQKCVYLGLCDLLNHYISTSWCTKLLILQNHESLWSVRQCWSRLLSSQSLRVHSFSTRKQKATSFRSRKFLCPYEFLTMAPKNSSQRQPTFGLDKSIMPMPPP
jgi:hypothetical protein